MSMYRRGDGLLQWSVSEGVSGHSEGALESQSDPDLEAPDVQQADPPADFQVLQADCSGDNWGFGLWDMIIDQIFKKFYSI